MISQDDTIVEQRGCYYLALHIVDGIDIFSRPVFKQIIVESLNHFIEKKDLVVYGWCLMSSHLNLIAEVKSGPGLFLLSEEFKKFTARIILQDIDAEPEARRGWIVKRFEKAGSFSRALNKYRVWQKNINAVYIDQDDPAIIGERLSFIHNNPVRSRIVARPEDYLHSSARDYYGMKGLVDISLLDNEAEPEFVLRHISHKYLPGY